MGARGLKLELDRYVNTIINFCIKKNESIDVTVDIGSNYLSKSKYYLKFFGLATGDPSVPNDIKTKSCSLKNT